MSLTRDGLALQNNAHNEVCHGVRELADDGEFQTRLGWKRRDAMRLLDQVNAVTEIQTTTLPGRASACVLRCNDVRFNAKWLFVWGES